MSPLPGVPLSLPVMRLKLAQYGRPAAENLSASPSGSLARGVKLYAVSARTVLGGVPEICGDRLAEPPLGTFEVTGDVPPWLVGESPSSSPHAPSAHAVNTTRAAMTGRKPSRRRG